MRKPKLLLILLPVLLLVLAQSVDAQTTVRRPASTFGPRFGFTLHTGESADALKDDFNASPLVLQIGWQIEGRFASSPTNGFSGVTKLVPLVGGFDQGLILPTLTWLVGVRSPGGTEIGFGPHLSIRGASLAISGGITPQKGNLNIPIDLALVLSKKGTRISLLFGFSL